MGKIKYTKLNKGRDCPPLFRSVVDPYEILIIRPPMHHLFRGTDGTHRWIRPKQRRQKVVWIEFTSALTIRIAKTKNPPTTS